jgi:pimeloyl-ACP methyl ester carboxylesterase
VIRATWLALMLVAASLATPASAVSAEEPAPAPASSAAIRGSYAEVGGQRLYYEISGQGPSLLLLHGGLSSSAGFEQIVPALAQHFRVLAVDRVGHGRSTDNGKPFVYSTMADEMKALLDHLGIFSTSVLGWSDGGVVGYQMASRYPGLVMARRDRCQRPAGGGRPDRRWPCRSTPRFADLLGRRDYQSLSNPERLFELDAVAQLWLRPPPRRRAQRIPRRCCSSPATAVTFASSTC